MSATTVTKQRPDAIYFALPGRLVITPSDIRGSEAKKSYQVTTKTGEIFNDVSTWWMYRRDHLPNLNHAIKEINKEVESGSKVTVVAAGGATDKRQPQRSESDSIIEYSLGKMEIKPPSST